MPSSPSLQVGLKFHSLSFCLHCCDGNSSLPCLLLWFLWNGFVGMSWKACLCVALTTAAREPLSCLILSFCGSFRVVAHWSVGQEEELNAGVSFHKGLSSFLWEVLKLMMMEWSRLLSKCVSQGHWNSVTRRLIEVGLLCFSVSVCVGYVEELLILTGLHKQR